MSLPIPDATELRSKLLGLQMRMSTLDGRSAELKIQHAKLKESIAIAKARIDLAPMAAEAFTYLQEKAHARAVGEFEELLSAFVADVIPEAGAIRLVLGTERGAPALDLVLDNGGNDEDILHGNGGGLTNVVVTALTYAALARTNNRSLVVLDEPDCWLKASRVTHFTRVIAQVANPELDEAGHVCNQGIQTLMISHNSTSLMDPGAHILQLSDEDGVPVVESHRGASAWVDDSQEGLRFIAVENFRRHLNTRINLCPGLNVLAGDINLGKSTLFFGALRALAYGELSDAVIRHGAASAKVRVGLENEVVLEVERYKRSTGFKTIYRKYVSGVLTNEGPMEARSVPGFITDVLRIAPVDGLDIQLRSQKEPIFLLNEPASRRARLLSVGKEAGLLQSLIERHRTELKRDKEFVKKEEVNLAEISRTLRALSPLSSLSGMSSLLSSMLEDLADEATSRKNLESCINTLTPLQAKIKLLESHEEGLQPNIEVPTLKDTQGISRLIGQMQATYQLAQVPNLPGAPVLPPLADTRTLATQVAVIARGLQADAVLGAMQPAPAVPHIADTTTLRSAIEIIDKGLQASALLEALPVAPVVPVMPDSTKLREHISIISKGLKAEAVLARMPTPPALPVVVDSAAMAYRVKVLDKLSSDGKKLAATATQAEQLHQDANTALHDLMHELGVCPTCDTPFVKETHA